MRRRSKREPNNTESTGKIGHELPTNQPRPLVPNYPDELPRQESPRPAPAARSVAPPAPAATTVSRPHGHRHAPAAPSYATESPDSGRLELETQPDMPPAAVAGTADRSAAAPKGVVVLAIGLPGSGKTTWFGRRGITPLSSDLLRNILFDDVEEQR